MNRNTRYTIVTALINTGVIVCCIVVLGGMWMLSRSSPASASDSFELSPKQGVRICGKHLVTASELHSIAWPDGVQRLAERGGMKMRRYMRENWDDYVVAVIYLDDGIWYNIGRDDSLVLSYPDTTITSTDCLAAGDATEMTLYFASRNELAFDDTWTPTSRSGGYLVAFRFNEGSLSRGGRWGFENPDEAHMIGGTQ